MTYETPATVLVWDEQPYAGLLNHVLQQEGFHGLIADKLDEVALLAETKCPDIISLSDLPMLHAAMTARHRLYESPRTRHIPVVISLSETADAREFSAHQIGRTEYLFRPFPAQQLIATFHRLRYASSKRISNVLSFADIIINHNARRVYRNTRIVNLGPIEYQLLQHLIARPRQVFSRDELIAAVWGYNIHVVPRAVDVHISRIRKALNEFGEPNYIRTVRGEGYSIDSDIAPSAGAG
ncbi:two-component system phosphate regulon response regulator PhoB [Sinorhizobium terangae]|nr:winged helix-turn-helix domain-containing protein [Sinorhizobium terangae]MBB4189690.1 two-component system phosphate regulon response regulator PhoB [Sinorhizobium terangae]